MRSSLSVAGLGAGYFSQFHYEAWRRHQRADLIACADHDLSKASSSQAKAFYPDLDSMLENIKPDILDIITPPSTHMKAIEQAVSHGVETIICQKPFCQTLVEAEQVVELVKNTQTRVVIHENFRFQPWYRCFKDTIEKNRLGRLLQLSFRLRTGDGQGEDAYLARQPYFREMPRFLVHETGVHWVDTFRFLLGEPDTVYADLRTLNTSIAGEDAGVIVFGYSNGLRAVFDGNRLVDHGVENTRLTFGEGLLEGTDGVLSFDGTGKVILRRFGQTKHEVLLKAQSWSGFAGDCVYALQDHVIASILDGKPLENEARDYLAVLNTVETIYRSAETGMRIDL